MFGWIRNKVANFSEIDTYITYLEYEIDPVQSLSSVRSIVAAIIVGLSRIKSGDITATQFGNIYKELNADVMFKKPFENDKDINFAKSYLIMALFHSTDFLDTENGQMVIIKIFSFLDRCKDDSIKSALKKIISLFQVKWNHHF